MSKKLAQEEFLSRSQKVQAVVYDYARAIYDGRMKPVEIHCIKHNHTFMQKAGEHLEGQTGCHQCHLEKNMESRVAKRRAGLQDNEKKCNCCGVVKDKSEFVTNPIGADGLHSLCNTCRKARAKVHRERPEVKAATKVKAAQYTRDNRDKANAKSALRRANRNRATVDFGDKEFEAFFLKEIYNLSVLREEATGFKWQVDHTIPLLSTVVCGLHWHGNLRLIPAFDNLSKGNKYWPDMP